MNPSVQNKPEDRVIVQIVGQRNPIGGNSLSNRLKMLKGALRLHEPGSHHPPGVIILGQNQVLFPPRARKPEVMRGIMLV
jgi:hypothetical protein